VRQSKSATKVRTRRTSHPTKSRIRTITTYCNAGTRTAWTILRPAPKVITQPAPAPVTPARPAPSTFRLTLLHNNDGESKYVVGDSVPNYGGITRFKTVLERLRSQADTYSNFAEQSGAESKGTVTISSGDNYLAGLNLRASFQRSTPAKAPGTTRSRSTRSATTPPRSATTSTTSARIAWRSSSPAPTRPSS